MASTGIVRLGGLAAMVGGALWVVWSLLGRASMVAGGFLSDALLLLAALLTLAGLVGLHALQKGNFGGIGRVGFYVAAAGLLIQTLGALGLLVGGGAAEVFFQGLVAPVGSLTVLVGLVLYGAATLQARVLPSWWGLTLIVVPPVSFYMNSRVFYGSIALFGLLWVALGYALWSRTKRYRISQNSDRKLSEKSRGSLRW
jgi:hypothetical protein